VKVGELDQPAGSTLLNNSLCRSRARSGSLETAADILAEWSANAGLLERRAFSPSIAAPKSRIGSRGRRKNINIRFTKSGGVSVSLFDLK